MSEWQQREMARFDADGDDMRLGPPEPLSHCRYCGRELDYGNICGPCLAGLEEDE